MAQTKSKSSFRKKSNEALLSVFAIFMTFMPLITVGIWLKQTVFYDTRSVASLSKVTTVDSNPRLFEEPLVSVTFDDGWESVYSEAAPILHKYDIRTTQYVLTGTFEQPQYLSREQVLSLQQAGHEIGGHGQDHVDLTTLDDDSLYQELKLSKDALRQTGVAGPMPFASPYGAYSKKTRSEIQKYYNSHRNTEGDLSTIETVDMNVGPKLDRYNIVGFTVRKDTTEQQLLEAMQFAKKHNAWFVLTYHQIDKSRSEYSVTPKAFESHMKLIRSQNIKVVTIGDVIRTLDEKDS